MTGHAPMILRYYAVSRPLAPIQVDEFFFPFQVLAMHELSHDLWLPYKWMNAPFAWLINCPTCVASAATFKR